MEESQTQTFWDHLDALRGVLVRSCIAAVLASCVVFFFREEVFDIVLAPSKAGFVTYRILSDIAGEELNFSLQMISTRLASQFSAHIQISLIVGCMIVSPYILYSIFTFISPALYENERRNVRRFSLFGFVMFFLGAFLSYYMVFPLTIRFLGAYQVSELVDNMITLDSYIDTLIILTMAMGIVFELPILCILFASVGILSSKFMASHRRHAIVIILIVSAIITPTSDIFTLLVVSMPIYLLYELSYLIIKVMKK